MTQNASSILSLIGRLLLALLFILEGPAKVINSTATATLMGSVGLPNSQALAVLVGVFQIGMGLALLAGWYTRWSAVALAAFTVVATPLFHAYWSAPADQQFVQELLFHKNMAVVGGLLVVVALGPGAWSWDQRRSKAPARRSAYGA